MIENCREPDQTVLEFKREQVLIKKQIQDMQQVKKNAFGLMRHDLLVKFKEQSLSK